MDEKSRRTRKRTQFFRITAVMLLSLFLLSACGNTSNHIMGGSAFHSVETGKSDTQSDSGSYESDSGEESAVEKNLNDSDSSDDAGGTMQGDEEKSSDGNDGTFGDVSNKENTENLLEDEHPEKNIHWFSLLNSVLNTILKIGGLYALWRGIQYFNLSIRELEKKKNASYFTSYMREESVKNRGGDNEFPSVRKTASEYKKSFALSQADQSIDTVENQPEENESDSIGIRLGPADRNRLEQKDYQDPGIRLKESSKGELAGQFREDGKIQAIPVLVHDGSADKFYGMITESNLKYSAIQSCFKIIGLNRYDGSRFHVRIVRPVVLTRTGEEYTVFEQGELKIVRSYTG